MTNLPIAYLNQSVVILVFLECPLVLQPSTESSWLSIKIVSEYDQEIPQSQTACQNQWHHEEEPHSNYKTQGRQTKQRNLSIYPTFPFGYHGNQNAARN